MAKQDIAIGVAAGLAVAVLTPLAILLATGTLRRPLMRALERGGQILAEKASETFAEIQEIAEDLVVEMRAPSEIAVETAVASAAAAVPASTAESVGAQAMSGAANNESASA